MGAEVPEAQASSMASTRRFRRSGLGRVFALDDVSGAGAALCNFEQAATLDDVKVRKGERGDCGGSQARLIRIGQI